MGSSFSEIVLTGSMLMALPVAALAGLVSFLSPCVLPLVPGFVGHVAGSSGEQVTKWRGVAGAALFVLGFSFVFVSFGLAFGGLGAALAESSGPIVKIMGAVTIVLGLLFAGWLPGLSRDWHLRVKPKAGLASAPLLGAVFGLGWTPCMGPTLAAVQVLAFDEASAARGAVLSFAYSLGLGIPFVVGALAYQRLQVFTWLRRHQLGVMRIGGVTLIGLGVLLVTGLWGDVTATLQGWISGFEVVV